MTVRTIHRRILHRPEHVTIPPLLWPANSGHVFDRLWGVRQNHSAFGRHQNRPLQVTFDTASFSGLNATQHRALDALRELSHLDLIDALDTSPEYSPRLTFGDPEPDGIVPINVNDGPARLRGSYLDGSQHRQLMAWAPTLARQADPSHPDAQEALRSLMVLEAHMRLGRDLLITESEWPFDHRVAGVSRRGNPRRILDAAKIAGLFVRSRDNYTYSAKKRGFTQSFDRGLFYWVLARHLTPNMWHYVSVCSAADESEQGRRLAQAVLLRCDRAIQARDRIGEAFYGSDDANGRDEMLYHFDYLTLLLSGALDAQARVARDVYGIAINQKRASFRNADYRDRLSVADSRLHAIVSSPRTVTLLTLLYDVRNTIHAISLSNFSFRTPGSPEGGLSAIEIADSALGDRLLNAAKSLGPPEDWGLSVERHTEDDDATVRELVLLEPYTYATALVSECVRLVDEIAAATEVTRLFHGRPVPDIPPGPPKDDSTFSADVGDRLAVLAGF
jgi:hypothetical protein